MSLCSNTIRAAFPIIMTVLLVTSSQRLLTTSSEYVSYLSLLTGRNEEENEERNEESSKRGARKTRSQSKLLTITEICISALPLHFYTNGKV